MLALIQGTGMTVGWQIRVWRSLISAFTSAVATFVTGAVFMMWLGERVTERGIVAVSVLIFAGIVAGLPGAIVQSFESARQGDVNILALLVIAVLALPLSRVWSLSKRGQRRITILRQAAAGSQGVCSSEQSSASESEYGWCNSCHLR